MYLDNHQQMPSKLDLVVHIVILVCMVLVRSARANLKPNRNRVMLFHTPSPMVDAALRINIVHLGSVLITSVLLKCGRQGGK